MRLDKLKVKSDVKSTAKNIKELKKVMRESGHMITSSEFYDLRDLKHRATSLCMLIAHSRNRIHLKGKTLEEQKELVEQDDWLKQFQVAEEKAA